MKFFLVLCISLLTSSASNAQRFDAYEQYVSDAANYYSNGAYLNAALSYNNAFDTLQGALGPDLYNAAQAWAKANELDSSLTCLFRMSKPGISGFDEYNRLKNDEAFTALHTKTEWDSLLNMVQKNYVFKHNYLNYELIEELAQIRADDQEIRSSLTLLDSIFKDNPTQRQKLRSDMLYKDSINLAKVEEIINAYDWPSPSIIGYEGSTTIFLVIQHASPSVRQSYLPKFREAVKQGKALRKNLAFLEDRVLLDQGKPQIYGTQMTQNDDSNEWFIPPIIDPVNIDIRRKSMNLGSLSDYVKHWGLTWDLDEYIINQTHNKL